MNLHKTSEGSCGSSFSAQLLVEMEIQVKEGGISLHKTIREINLVYKGLIKTLTFQAFTLCMWSCVLDAFITDDYHVAFLPGHVTTMWPSYKVM